MTLHHLLREAARLRLGPSEGDDALRLPHAEDRIELEARLREDLKKTGDFARIHPLPPSGADVPDDLDARLVVLSADYPYSKELGNSAETAAKAILESRGNTPRLYRNSLVFLAAQECYKECYICEP